MKNFKQIDNCDVWPCLQAGKQVYAVILNSRYFHFGIEDLTDDCTVYKINQLLTEDNVAFFEKIRNEGNKL